MRGGGGGGGVPMNLRQAIQVGSPTFCVRRFWSYHAIAMRQQKAGLRSLSINHVEWQVVHTCLALINLELYACFSENFSLAEASIIQLSQHSLRFWIGILFAHHRGNTLCRCRCLGLYCGTCGQGKG